MADVPLASLSLTHVSYDPTDSVSLLCAWLSLLPQGLCVAYVTLIWSTREIEVLLMFMGQMGSEVLNLILKRLIKEERPQLAHGKGYGMPSSHSQFLGYFAAYLTLFLLIRHRPSGRAAASVPGIALPKAHSSAGFGHPSSFLERVLLSIFWLAIAGAVGEARIYLSYHTPRQVFAGLGAGAVCAIAWFIVTGVLRIYGVLDYILDMPISQGFRLKDLVTMEDLVDCGWHQWRALRLQTSQTREKDEHLVKKKLS